MRSTKISQMPSRRQREACRGVILAPTGSDAYQVPRLDGLPLFLNFILRCDIAVVPNRAVHLYPSQRTIEKPNAPGPHRRILALSRPPCINGTFLMPRRCLQKRFQGIRGDGQNSEMAAEGPGGGWSR